MKRAVASFVVLLSLAAQDLRIAAQRTPEWGSGVAPFGLALIGDNLPSNPQLCPSGFKAFLDRLELRAQQYARPVVLAHGDDHFFFVDQPLKNLLFTRVQTYGEALVHWVKVHVDPKSSGVFSIEQKIVRANL